MILQHLDHLRQSLFIAKGFLSQIQQVPHIGMMSSQTTRSSLYAVCTTATQVKPFHNICIHLFIDIVTSNGSQMAIVSWWPTPVHRDNHNANSYNWGIGGTGLSGMRFGTSNSDGYTVGP